MSSPVHPAMGLRRTGTRGAGGRLCTIWALGITLASYAHGCIPAPGGDAEPARPSSRASCVRHTSATPMHPKGIADDVGPSTSAQFVHNAGPAPPSQARREPAGPDRSLWTQPGPPQTRRPAITPRRVRDDPIHGSRRRGSCRRPGPRRDGRGPGPGLRGAHRSERGRQPAPHDHVRRLPRRRGALRHGLPVRRRRWGLREPDAAARHPLEGREGRRLDAPATAPGDRADRPPRSRGLAGSVGRTRGRSAHGGPDRRPRHHRPARRRRPGRRVGHGARLPAPARFARGPRLLCVAQPDLPRRGLRCRRGRRARPGGR